MNSHDQFYKMENFTNEKIGIGFIFSKVRDRL